MSSALATSDVEGIIYSSTLLTLKALEGGGFHPPVRVLVDNFRSGELFH